MRFWKVLSAYLRYCQRNHLEQSLHGLVSFAAWLEAGRDKPQEQQKNTCQLVEG